MDSTESGPRLVFLSHEGHQDGIEILIDQLSPGAVARAFSVKLNLNCDSHIKNVNNLS